MYSCNLATSHNVSIVTIILIIVHSSRPSHVYLCVCVRALASTCTTFPIVQYNNIVLVKHVVDRGEETVVSNNCVFETDVMSRNTIANQKHARVCVYTYIIDVYIYVLTICMYKIVTFSASGCALGSSTFPFGRWDNFRALFGVRCCFFHYYFTRRLKRVHRQLFYPWLLCTSK